MSKKNKMYQVSTLQALALGYTKAVITVRELLEHGDTGLGTYEDVNGEMIAMDGHCYQAKGDGSVAVADPETGVPFCAVAKLLGEREFEMTDKPDIESIRTELTQRIEEHFGLNSMHVVRIDGEFIKVDARSEEPYKSHHVTLKEVLDKNQTSFVFENIRGSLVGVYFPDHMDGNNMPGWHLHFLSEDKSKGGHVFNVIMKNGLVRLDKISRIEIELPKAAAFDTYSLKQASEEEIKKVEKG
jgi:acetolactate decarboxylase